MTPKEFLRAINLPEDEPHLKWANDTMDLAEVIERDTPLMAINKDRFGVSECTKCGADVQEYQCFCFRCGQRLDWSE